ncbi:hypothetical protein chiPu_0028594 [Chiloscyllium punctatum]|uniref:Uncharacterized protein n=1 Tax=Chiloscyllium punctatum TaxID=137246 RepID=A0A401TP15_CHIPU|nr:hypothetical protein [Chiloscyllium punctatum]
MIDLARGLANEAIEEEKGPEGQGGEKDTEGSLCHCVPEDMGDRENLKRVGRDIENTLTLSFTALSQVLHTIRVD